MLAYCVVWICINFTVDDLSFRHETVQIVTYPSGKPYQVTVPRPIAVDLGICLCLRYRGLK